MNSHDNQAELGTPMDSSTPNQRSEKSRQERNRQRVQAESVFARFLWFFTSVAFVLCIWKVGPQIIEDYQYSMVKGKIRAEYENAVEILDENPLGGVSEAYQLVAQKIRPSVVSVKALKKGKRSSNGRRRVPPSDGLGSGVIMSEEGYILTNEHVISDAFRIEVTLFDRRVYEATVVGNADKYNDLAVLKIEATDLVPAQWGDSDELEVGSIVWAIGSPFGLDQSVTSGIISAKNRYDQKFPQQELLQTDAAVNPGNSGGPLVDAQGQVVGINASIYGDQFQGISFAVPSVQAKFVYEETLEQGYVDRGRLGVEPAAVFQKDAQRLGLPDIAGAKLRFVETGSPAHSGGLQVDDVVRQWNGKRIEDYHMLYRYVSMTPPGSLARVTIIRDGLEQDLDIRVGKLPR